MCNGQPCIAGAGLSVTDLGVAHLFHCQTPDGLVFPQTMSPARRTTNLSSVLACGVPGTLPDSALAAGYALPLA